MDIKILKRDGRLESYQADKVNKPVQWACEGLKTAYPSQILMSASRSIYDGITSDALHEELINAAAGLISEEYPDTQYAAGRLLIFQMRKRAFGQFEPPHLYDHVKTQVEAGRYDPELLNTYSWEEYQELNSVLDHTKDLDLAYIAARQLQKKYLLQNRVTGQLFESPQQAFMLIPMALYSGYPKEQRMDLIKRFYVALSEGSISLPTPIMAGARTPTRQFSSCVKIDSGDSLDSINASASAIVKYISQRAGIGINAGNIRAKGSPIRGGEAEHTGLVPFIKHFHTAVKSCSQGAVRDGSATLYFPIWHYEVEDLIVLKNNKGTEETRCRGLDYAVQINELMYRRLKQGGMISLFSPSDVPGLYEAFFADQSKFEELYLKYEADVSIRRKTVKAVDLFGLIGLERVATGRIYIQNVDHCNRGPFCSDVAPIRMLNLCAEIALPTRPMDDISSGEGEIALCTLAAFNVGKLDDLDDLEELAELIVRILDALLDYQNYPVKAGERGGLGRRALGVGVTGFATYLAKRGGRYSDGSGLEMTHQLFESMQYYLLKASNKLARELGPCPLYHETTYSQGVLPIDRYVKKVDKLGAFEYLHDWETLRADILAHGLRNSTVTAIMPCETSSAVTNSINGIEPPRGLVMYKTNKDAVMAQVVPEFEVLKDTYECLWDIKSNRGYLDLVAIMQKFVDQAISTNINHDPANYPDSRVPIQVVLKEMLYAHAMGVKSLYYHNTRDGNDADAIAKMDDGCEGGACKL